jgi:hypothetical protein
MNAVRLEHWVREGRDDEHVGDVWLVVDAVERLHD